MDTAGAVLGPLIAIAFLLAFGQQRLRPLFIIALVPGLASLVLLARLPESTRPAAQRWEPEKLPWRGRYGWFVAVTMLFGIGNSSDAFLLLRANNLGLGFIAVIAAYALYNTLYAALSYPAGALSDRRSRYGIFAVGLVIFAVVYTAFGIVDSPGWAWPLFAVYGAYIALTDGISRAIIVDLVPETVRGKAIGVWQALYGASVLVSGITAGLLWDRVSPRAPFFLGGATALLAAIVLIAGLAAPGIRRSSPVRS
jgi:MFS family permease